MIRTLLLSSLAVLASASLARAAETVATAGQLAAPPAADTAAQIDAFIKQAPPVKLDDGAPDGVVGEEEPRKIHGEVGVSVGSGGYRSGYAMAVMPLGETGTLAVAVSETRFGRQGGRGWSGGLAPGRFGASGLGPEQRQTLGVSLAYGESARAGCHGRARGLDPYGLEGPGGFEHAACRIRDADR